MDADGRRVRIDSLTSACCCRHQPTPRRSGCPTPPLQREKACPYDSTHTWLRVPRFTAKRPRPWRPSFVPSATLTCYPHTARHQGRHPQPALRSRPGEGGTPISALRAPIQPADHADPRRSRSIGNNRPSVPISVHQRLRPAPRSPICHLPSPICQFPPPDGTASLRSSHPGRSGFGRWRGWAPWRPVPRGSGRSWRRSGRSGPARFGR